MARTHDPHVPTITSSELEPLCTLSNINMLLKCCLKHGRNSFLALKTFSVGTFSAPIFAYTSFWSVSRSSQCSTTGVTMPVVCVILSVGWCI